jgi:uncharacterized membrane protein
MLASVFASMISPGAMPDGQTGLLITDSGLGSTFHAGDVATGYMVVANNGSSTIHDVKVTVTVYPDAILGFPAGYHSETFNVELAPGESKRIEYSQPIPAQLIGISTAGHYRLDIKVEADGGYVTTLQRSVDIV